MAKLKLEDGAKYEGDVVNGVPHGIGKLTSKLEDYEGEFADGKKTGKGKLTVYSKNGKTKKRCGVSYEYEGDFVDGKLNGSGIIKCYDAFDEISQIWEGKFTDNKLNGKGKNTSYSKGEIFYECEGNFVNGNLHGKGKYKNKNESYEGDFQFNKDAMEGKYQGKGKITYSYGDVYEGDFIQGEKSGLGKMIYKDGKIEEGYWFNDKYYGKGSKGKANMEEAIKEYNKPLSDYDMEMIRIKNEVCP